MAPAEAQGRTLTSELCRVADGVLGEDALFRASEREDGADKAKALVGRWFVGSI